VFIVPGENPNDATLSGTNHFVIGTGPKRTMIDCGDKPELNGKFIENLGIFMEE